MKNNIYYIVFIALTIICVLVGCSLKDEKAEMIESLNYKKACELKEFTTAYEIVDKLKEKTSSKKITFDECNSRGSSFTDQAYSEYKEAKKKSDEAERYVILQEAMLVLENEGTNGLMRIVAIAKEHKAEGWLYSEMADLANKIDDTDLEEKFNNLKEDFVEGELVPSTTSISGPLNGYFEIVEKKYKSTESSNYAYSYEIFIELKRKKPGYPIKKYTNLELEAEFFDKNDHVIETNYANSYYYDKLYNCNVGDVVSISFNISNKFIDSARKIRISSSIDR